MRDVNLPLRAKVSSNYSNQLSKKEDKCARAKLSRTTNLSKTKIEQPTRSTSPPGAICLQTPSPKLTLCTSPKPLCAIRPPRTLTV